MLDDAVYVLSPRQERSLADLRDATWIAGCDRLAQMNIRSGEIKKKMGIRRDGLKWTEKLMEWLC